ncbi:MAG: hypothetical protein E7484_01845 [Ruminococcaceae bacterium]|nr:hypothetical protein [Oscillospiraceae bacterium]
MKTADRKSIGYVMDKALKSPVTQQVRDEIASVLDVNTDRMTARQAIVYAQIAKAIRGDKAAFEAVSSVAAEATAADKSFCVEVKVVE